jgi:hypothetical protein
MGGLTQRAQNGTWKPLKNASFSDKLTLFAHSQSSQQDVRSWKMIACHHYEVHWTACMRCVFQAFIRTERVFRF